MQLQEIKWQKKINFGLKPDPQKPLNRETFPFLKEIADKYLNLADMADTKWSKLENLKATLAQVSI